MPSKQKKTLTVLLNKNTRHLGNAGTVATVRSGFARNFLLPQKIAEKATKTNLSLIERKQEQFRLENEKQKELLTKLKTQLESNTNFIIQKRTREDNTIFGNITKKEIVEILEKEVGASIEKSMIDLPEMKSIGDYNITVHLEKNIKANIKFSLLSQ